MTWNHRRGYAPMAACSALWRETTGTEISWDARSLQDFECFPVERLARAYDLIVIDHPHVGQATTEGCLAPLNVEGREAELAALASRSVGQSYASYNWRGRQWALPIDAAALVQVWRPDLLGAPLTRWSEVVELAREGRVLLPLRPPHGLMVFYTLCANLGQPCLVDERSDFVGAELGCRVFEMMKEIAALIDPACLEMDPIAVSERMAGEGASVACAPLAYGYASYAMAGFRANLLSFANIPAAGSRGPVGSVIGGTGIAVSAFCKAKEEAIDFAYWIASADVQRGPYARAGGQPGHAAAWEDAAVNAATGGFYRNTRAALEAGWVRPRHNGYMVFQQAASQRLSDGLAGRHAARHVVDDLNRLFGASFLQPQTACEPIQATA
jgi:multiple sugar transport system substrate-binding protein